MLPHLQQVWKAILFLACFVLEPLSKKQQHVFNTCDHNRPRRLTLRGSFFVLFLLIGQAAGTGLHGNSDAHAAASERHIRDARPFISIRTVALDAGQKAVLIKAS